MFKKISYWLGVVVWCGLIFYFSNIPDLKTELEPVWDLILRKLAHMVEYGILFLLVCGAVSSTWSWQKKIVYLIAAVFAILYAISDEYHQSFVPGRGPSVVDVGVDTAGILLFYYVFIYSIQNKVYKR